MSCPASTIQFWSLVCKSNDSIQCCSKNHSHRHMLGLGTKDICDPLPAFWKYQHNTGYCISYTKSERLLSHAMECQYFFNILSCDMHLQVQYIALARQPHFCNASGGGLAKATQSEMDRKRAQTYHWSRSKTSCYCFCNTKVSLCEHLFTIAIFDTGCRDQAAERSPETETEESGIVPLARVARLRRQWHRYRQRWEDSLHLWLLCTNSNK